MKIITLLFAIFGVCCGVQASLDTGILYSVEQISANRWQYTYEVQNISFAPGIEQFTIWFDLGNYENLSIESIGIQAEWIESLWQPEPLLLDDGAFDAKTLTVPITVGNRYSGFSVSFDWLGQETPGLQFYEIVNPDSLLTIDSGYTQIPEPLSLGLLFTGMLFLKRKNK